jgi:hypothetical protein
LRQKSIEAPDQWIDELVDYWMGAVGICFNDPFIQQAIHPFRLWLSH